MPQSSCLYASSLSVLKATLRRLVPRGRLRGSRQLRDGRVP